MKQIINKNKSIFFVFFLFWNLLNAQCQIDSLNKIINQDYKDTNFINASISVSEFYLYKNINKSLTVLENSLKTSLSLKFKVHLLYYNLAYAYCENSNYQKALEHYQLAESYCSKNTTKNVEKSKARIEEGRSNVYERINNLVASISLQKKAISLYESIHDTGEIFVANLNLARLYNINSEFAKARDTYFAANKFMKHKDDSVYLHNAFVGIGTSYLNENNAEKAIYYYNLAEIFRAKLDAENYVSKATILINLSESYTLIKNYSYAIELGEEALKIYSETESINNVKNVYITLAKLYALNNQSQQSSNYYEKYVILSDSLDKINNKELLHEMAIKYETDKKEKENQVLTLGNKNKQLTIYFALGGCFLLLGLVFFIFKGYKTKQKANQELEVKNEIIQQQKTIVEEQHQDITDSIKYAQRIQGAILPPKNMWKKILPNSFVLYMPKDVLSGDFYWIEETKDYVYVAAADCTGHGVPGALMSIVNFNLLNKALHEKDFTTPSDILDCVNQLLTESLHQTYRESAVKDGMDVTLVAIHKHSNEVLFAGANNPIYVVSQGELKQIKGDKFPVGAFVDEKIQKFTTKRFTVQKGDCIYLFSDGYADQFGGPKGKKYKYAPFQEKLKNNHNLPLNQQLNIMKTEFTDWKGALEQVDDVLLIGIKIV